MDFGSKTHNTNFCRLRSLFLYYRSHLHDPIILFFFSLNASNAPETSGTWIHREASRYSLISARRLLSRTVHKIVTA
ncbi:hypothetical protein A0H81_13808 [Grifola frondosa]|uniref:Uncharacterized protein n=1 Tax=Grifola frondosa TaxID=5627 RepID=A0A1C7LNR4_GRIFR|nr:hypothetical protein A0H81_13808 [Grifola frondosa]